MAIGITGQNHGVVGPRSWPHVQSYGGNNYFGADYFPVISACVDVANPKCYSGSGNTITDFVSGVTFSIYGNSGDVTFKTDNGGILEITGQGYIESTNTQYQFLDSDNEFFSNKGFALEFWMYAATGHTQNESILQFGQIDNGVFKNGIKLIRNYNPASVNSSRLFRVETYDNQGNMQSSTFNSTDNSVFGPLYSNEWTYVQITESVQISIPGVSYFKTNYLLAKSKTINRIMLQTRNNVDNLFHRVNASWTIIQPETEYKSEANRILKIGKVDGVTGFFRGKIGALKIYNKSVRVFDDEDFKDPEDPESGLVYFAHKPATLNYHGLAPRYNQYP